MNSRSSNRVTPLSPSSGGVSPSGVVSSRAEKYAKDREDKFDSQLERNIKNQKVEKDKTYLHTSSYDMDDEYSTLNVTEEEHQKFTLKGMSSEQLLKERKRYN
jgi:hypothetical protein